MMPGITELVQSQSVLSFRRRRHPSLPQPTEPIHDGPWGSTIGLFVMRDDSINARTFPTTTATHNTKPQLPPASLSLAANICTLLLAAYLSRRHNGDALWSPTNWKESVVKSQSNHSPLLLPSFPPANRNVGAFQQRTRSHGLPDLPDAGASKPFSPEKGGSEVVGVSSQEDDGG
ncbi:hypothetical protein PG984_000914 [Apiospora sp. TS-2023a]